MELKAFSKSIWRTPTPSLFPHSSYISFVAWIIDSAPPLMATPSWFRQKISNASFFAKETKHLTTRRRKTSPTAMGRTPVFLSVKAVREALQKVGPTSFGKPLAAQKLIRLVSFCIANLDCSRLLQRMTFDRCPGYIMLGPAAAPLGKEDNMSLTTLSENWYPKHSSSKTCSICSFSLGWREQRPL